MNNLEEVDPADEPRTYRQQSYPKRLLGACRPARRCTSCCVRAALILLAVVGVPDGTLTDRRRPRPTGWSTRSRRKRGRAAGLEAGDRIVTIDGQPVDDFDQIPDAIPADRATRSSSMIERDGQ